MSELYDPKLSHFDIDVKRGAQGELYVRNIMKMLAERTGAVEVKTDAKYPVTGNLYVEFQCCGRDGVWRDSGIRVTKAMLWAFVFGVHPGVLFVATEWLRDACRIAERNGKVAECKYGQNPTRGFLIREADLRASRDKGRDEHIWA